jgi:hypothetical protein
MEESGKQDIATFTQGAEETTQAPKPEQKASSFGEYPQPYVFW